MQLIGFGFLLLSLAVGAILKNKFKKFSTEKLSIGLTGREIAEKMLKDNNIYDVNITCVDGALTDHYNPLNKTVNLSREVYENSSVAAAAVAAHECGHAVQHEKGYAFLKLRSTMVPVTSFASRIMPWVIFGGFMTIKTMPMLLEAGIALFAITTLFTIITLPVEFDASKRALEWIQGHRIVNDKEYSNAKSALSWAAMTYIIAALGSLAQLLHLLAVANRRRD